MYIFMFIYVYIYIYTDINKEMEIHTYLNRMCNLGPCERTLGAWTRRGPCSVILCLRAPLARAACLLHTAVGAYSNRFLDVTG